MDSLYRRPALAQSLAARLLKPDVLDEGLRSGLFLSGLRRTGKTTFLRNDLIPALEAAGAVVIYVDLWSDTQTSPASLVHGAIRRTLRELRTKGSALLARLARFRGVTVAAAGLSFGFDIDAVGTSDGPTLADVMVELVDQADTDVVLIVDEVQQALASDEGSEMLLALKAARDAVNARPATPGHLLFVGTGSHRALVAELVTRRNQAFAGATSIPFPVLDEDYVSYLLERLQENAPAALPSLASTAEAFRLLGHRPEELLKALRQASIESAVGGDPDAVLPVIARTLRSSAADLELSKVDALGALATLLFERIASSEHGVKGLFAAEALADYAQRLGRHVGTEDVQRIVNELMESNLILRRGHGLYAVSDPFVQTCWQERAALPRVMRNDQDASDR